jgi:hypothetical protein
MSAPDIAGIAVPGAVVICFTTRGLERVVVVHQMFYPTS